MIAAGIPLEDIAGVIINPQTGHPITRKTLSLHFRDEIRTGGTLATAKVADTLFRKATSPQLSGPSVTAAIFWLKTKAGWKETQAHELTGKDGGPIQHEGPSARDEIARRIAGIAARAGPDEDPS